MLGFLIACRLYIRMKMRDAMVKKQVQWILSYMQEGLADMWKENVIEDLESKNLSYATVEKFLTDLKK